MGKGNERISIKMNTSIISWIGTALTVCGSIVLAWRVKIILEWVHHSIISHESSIRAIIERLENRKQSYDVIIGTNVHLSNAINDTGTKLLRLGFAMIGLGIATQLLSIYLLDH